MPFNDIRVIAFALLSASVAATPSFAAPGDTIADAVLGQFRLDDNVPNQGGLSLQFSLNEPYGVAISPSDGRLWVADRENHRVLSWPDPASFVNREAADIVLGQEGFFTNLANKGMAGPLADTLNSPKTLALDAAGRLYVADTGNFRILRYDPPILSAEDAVQVFGQPDFGTALQNFNGPSDESIGSADGVAVDAIGNLYLADGANHRVLIFNTPAADDTVADTVLGQVNFTNNDVNAGLGDPGETTFNTPVGVAVDAAGNLYVCDQGNNRVLLFTPPFVNNEEAVKVFGQPNFITELPNFGSLSATSLFGPIAAAIDPVTDRLYIADTGNHRILEYEDPVAGDTEADRVFGQIIFTTGVANKGGDTMADTVNGPTGVVLDDEGNLYAADRLNNRVLRYDATGGGGLPPACGACGAGLTPLMPLAVVGLIVARRIRRRS
ncbi:MAG TPA: NHL repeat-containing protein [Phycisphaerae bacterium]|nr:NHL repeat-containing protein [Phycisphaerae bacterium]